MYFMLTSGAVSWRSAKQILTVTSTIEAEFISYCEAISHDVMMKSFKFLKSIIKLKKKNYS